MQIFFIPQCNMNYIGHKILKVLLIQLGNQTIWKTTYRERARNQNFLVWFTVKSQSWITFFMDHEKLLSRSISRNVEFYLQCSKATFDTFSNSGKRYKAEFQVNFLHFFKVNRNLGRMMGEKREVDGTHSSSS